MDARASHPRLPQFLVLVDAITRRCSDLVAALVPIEQVPSLLAVHEARTRVRRLAFDLPWTTAILTQLGVVQPHPDPAPIAARSLGLRRPRSSGCCSSSRTRGWWRRPPTGSGWWRRLHGRHPGHRRGFRQRLREHWSDVSRPAGGCPRAVAGRPVRLQRVQRVVRRSPAIHALQAATYHEIRGFVAASTPSETSALLLTHLLAWPLGE